MSLADGMLMSGFVYSGAAQFVGLELIGSRSGLWTILLTTTLLSLRFLLYGLTLADEVKGFSLPMRLLLGFLLIDQVFVLAKARQAEPGSPEAKNAFLICCALLFYVNWILGTLIGGVIGREYADAAVKLGVNFIAVATFAAMLGPYLRTSRNCAAAVVSVVVYLLASGLPYGLGIPLACVCSIVLVELLWSARRKAT